VACAKAVVVVDVVVVVVVDGLGHPRAMRLSIETTRSSNSAGSVRSPCCKKPRAPKAHIEPLEAEHRRPIGDWVYVVRLVHVHVHDHDHDHDGFRASDDMP
jgi:hypothetical protein